MAAVTVRLPSRRVLIALVATIVVLAPIAFFWQRSLVPNDLSAMNMGYADYGGGPAEHAHHGVDVSTLTGPTNRAADVVGGSGRAQGEASTSPAAGRWTATR